MYRPVACCSHYKIGQRLLVTILATFLGTLPVFAFPKPGTPAPSLRFEHLLQAPPRATADWHSLHGKVVVLEFWATWCVPCVASLPHLNQLVASLDPAKFQFISIDDEDLKVVQDFLTKRKMAGWVGIDTTKGVFKRYSSHYGDLPRPTTIIVDGRGVVVAVTYPENLTGADLRAVAAGKSVQFRPADSDEPRAKKANGSVSRAKPPPAPIKPLYQLTLNEASSEAYSSCGFSEHDGLTGRAESMLYMRSTESLLSVAYNDIPEDRFVSTSPLPERSYDLCVVYGRADSVKLPIVPFLQAAITYGLNLRVEPKTITKKAYILKTTEASKTLLVPQPPIRLSRGFYVDGKVYLINGSVDDLATALENGLQVPVVNETGIEGRFDAELAFPARDVNAARAVLRKVIGLELVEGDRPIPLFEVSPQEDGAKSAKSKSRQ